MKYCAAYKCKNNNSKKCPTPRKSFHQFPLNNKALLDKWLQNVGRKSFMPTNSSTLCGDHFEETCFKVDMFEAIVGRPRGTKKKTMLKEGAVPTLFSHRQTPAPRVHTEERIKRLENKRMVKDLLEKQMTSRPSVKSCDSTTTVKDLVEERMGSTSSVESYNSTTIKIENCTAPCTMTTSPLAELPSQLDVGLAPYDGTPTRKRLDHSYLRQGIRKRLATPAIASTSHEDDEDDGLLRDIAPLGLLDSDHQSSCKEAKTTSTELEPTGKKPAKSKWPKQYQWRPRPAVNLQKLLECSFEDEEKKAEIERKWERVKMKLQGESKEELSVSSVLEQLLDCFLLKDQQNYREPSEDITCHKQDGSSLRAFFEMLESDREVPSYLQGKMSETSASTANLKVKAEPGEEKSATIPVIDLSLSDNELQSQLDSLSSSSPFLMFLPRAVRADIKTEPGLDCTEFSKKEKLENMLALQMDCTEDSNPIELQRMDDYCSDCTDLLPSTSTQTPKPPSGDSIWLSASCLGNRATLLLNRYYASCCAQQSEQLGPATSSQKQSASYRTFDKLKMTDWYFKPVEPFDEGNSVSLDREIRAAATNSSNVSDQCGEDTDTAQESNFSPFESENENTTEPLSDSDYQPSDDSVKSYNPSQDPGFNPKDDPDYLPEYDLSCGDAKSSDSEEDSLSDDCGLELTDDEEAKKSKSYKLHLDASLLCYVCGKTFSKTSSLTIHLLASHGGRQYICEVCGYSTTVKQRLSQHNNTVHLRVRNLACAHCGLKLATEARLKRHVQQVHENIRNFTCGFGNCNKKFKTTHAVKIHRRIHTGDKPVKCSLCKFSARQKASLNWHMKTKHK